MPNTGLHQCAALCDRSRLPSPRNDTPHPHHGSSRPLIAHCGLGHTGWPCGESLSSGKMLCRSVFAAVRGRLMLFVCVCVCLSVHITLGCGEGLSSAHPAALQPDRLLCYGKPLITPSRREYMPCIFFGTLTSALRWQQTWCAEILSALAWAQVGLACGQTHIPLSMGEPLYATPLATPDFHGSNY